MRIFDVKLPLLQILRSIRASYWFVPSVMLALAIVFGALVIWLDTGPLAGLLDDLSWYQKSKPEGAREVLSTIAGSMITVAGVVFSITIVAISFAASQYGPRILTNFMRDRGNQVTLGTFVATFAYAVVVLRTIHAGDSEFVPQLAVVIALLLSLCSIAVLIYFIHHVPESIHINTITARIGRQLLGAIEEQFPERLGEPPERTSADEQQLREEADKLFAASGETIDVPSTADGYLQVVDNEALMEAARKFDVTIKLEKAPGDFLFHGQTVARVTHSDCEAEEVCRAVQGSWTTGSKRTPDQDPLFLVDELVEIAARALSAGVNDPHTANTCVDWLTAAAAKLGNRRSPSAYRVDCDGCLRVVAPSGDFKLHVHRGFGQLRPYLAGDVTAAVHALSSMAALAEACRSGAEREVLVQELDALTELAQNQLEGPSENRLIETSAASRRALTGKSFPAVS